MPPDEFESLSNPVDSTITGANDQIAADDLALPAIPPERVPFWGYVDLLLVVGLLAAFSAVIIVLVGLLAIPFPSLRTDPTPIALPVQILFYGALYLSFYLVFKLRYGKPVFRALGWQKPGVNLVWMAVGGVVLAFVLSLLGTALKTPKVPLPFEKLTNTPGMLVFFGLIAVILAPIFEELFFRGFIQPVLSRTMGAVAGVVITAVLFGLLHGFEYSWVWQYAVFISLAGIIFGWLRARTDSVIPSIVMHGFFNAVSVVALAFGKDI
jgi:uncharacterized protein